MHLLLAAELWLPLPREEDRAVMELRLAGTAPATVVCLAPSGDRAAYVRVAEPKGTVTLTETATVGRCEVRAPVGVSRASPADIDPAAYAAELASGSGDIRITDEASHHPPRDRRQADRGRQGARPLRLALRPHAVRQVGARVGPR